MYNSCTNNGTSGFQLDYLLRERVINNEINKDIYMYKKHKITTKEQTKNFIYYLQVLLENDNYFPNSIKPKIHQDYKNSESNSSKNKFSSYDNWIHYRNTQRMKGLSNDATFNAELAYFKIYMAWTWLKQNNDLSVGEYPRYSMYRVDLSWDLSIFNYTKYDHNFSIFFNNEGNNDIPYIKNYYILQYTTIYDIIKYEYSLIEGHKSLTNMNHGALDGNKYHLLTTDLFDRSMEECLRALQNNMQYIFKYGEFLHPEYDSLNRWGGLNFAYFQRKYLPTISNLKIDVLIKSLNLNIIQSEIIKNIRPNSKLTKEIENAQFLGEKNQVTLLEECSVYGGKKDLIQNSEEFINTITVPKNNDIIHNIQCAYANGSIRFDFNLLKRVALCEMSQG